MEAFIESERQRLNEPITYQIISLPGSTHAVVIGTNAVLFPPLDFQCAVNNVAALTGDANLHTDNGIATATLSSDGRYKCIASDQASGYWYANPQRKVFTLFDTQLGAINYRSQQGGFGYVYPAARG